ncbi:hypothetical protein CON09_08255 [Bacillus anthracis]|nr:hypothetical protein CON09_08255 [Bacillus anthracis]
MIVEELVYGYKGNETYLTLYFNKVEMAKFNTLQNRSAVYMIYSKENELMYIGETTKLCRRMVLHLNDGRGGKKAINRDTVGYIQYAYLTEDRYERGIIEGLLVQKYKPLLNCDDSMKAGAISKVEKSVIHDALFYIRNTDIPLPILARILGVSQPFLKSIRYGGTFNNEVLPKGFKPSILITDQDIEDNSYSRKWVDQNLFNQIRKLLEEGSLNQSQIAHKYGISDETVRRIKNLVYKKHKQWEAERTGKAVA